MPTVCQAFIHIKKYKKVIMLAWRTTLSLLIAVIVCAMFVVNVRYQSRALNTQLEKVRQQEQQLQVEWSTWQVQQVAASKNDRIAQQVSKQDMQRVDPSVTYYMTPISPAQIKPAPPTGAQPCVDISPHRTLTNQLCPS